MIEHEESRQKSAEARIEKINKNKANQEKKKTQQNPIESQKKSQKRGLFWTLKKGLFSGFLRVFTESHIKAHKGADVLDGVLWK